MDAEKLLQAFSTDEIQELANALPADLLRRGIQVGPTVVQAAQAAEAKQALERAKTRANKLKQGVTNFLNPEVDLSLADQFETMADFWSELGLDVPRLTLTEQQKLSQSLETYPDRRVMPVPLLDLDSRQAMAEQAKTALPGNRFGSSVALWTPGESSIYGKLLRDPEATVKDGRNSYGLRYHTEDGVITRSELVAKLTESGQAITAEDGTVWLFPVMDVRVKSPRQYTRAEALHRQAGITQIPESLITMQMLHQVNGTPNPDGEVDFTNEAVYELDKKAGAVAPVRVAGVRWYPDDRQVDLDTWRAGGRSDIFGVRAAERG